MRWMDHPGTAPALVHCLLAAGASPLQAVGKHVAQSSADPPDRRSAGAGMPWAIATERRRDRRGATYLSRVCRHSPIRWLPLGSGGSSVKEMSGIQA